MHYFPRSRSGQVHSLMAALTCLRSVETNLTLTCPSPKSFVCNLPDSGRHVTSVFQGLSLSRFVGRVGENPGNEVALTEAETRYARIDKDMNARELMVSSVVGKQSLKLITNLFLES